MISIFRLLLFPFKYKTEIATHYKEKFGELEKNPKLNTTKPNYCDLHCDRENVFFE